MQTGTIVMMVLILGIVWGGFVGLLIYSMKVEGRREPDSPPAEAPPSEIP